MTVAIVPTAEPHFEGLYRAIDAVARERRYLALVEAPPVEASFAFYRSIVTDDLCQFVAIQDGAIVGWCDILPVFGHARAHVGHLGMGVVAHARGNGIGTQLLAATLAKASQKGISRVELSVRADNPSAKALYERFGFVVEGVSRRAVRVDGEFFDCFAMALLF